MMVLHILELLTDALFGEWEGMQWAVASSICDSILRAFRDY
jgi:hypothetical protein